jgi:hypothetical protein
MEIIDVRQRPELQELANHLRETKQITILRDADEEIATITPANLLKRGSSPRRSRSLRPDDSLWNIVGMDQSPDSPTDVSSNKHKYLAEAYLHEHK